MKRWQKIFLPVTLLLAMVVGSIQIPWVWAAISNISGIAVQGSSIQWNNVKDASQGNALTNGLPATAVYGYNGTTWDGMPGTTANGLDVDVTRVQGTVTIAGATTPADAFANPTTALTGWTLNGVFNGTTWDRRRSATADALASTGLAASGLMGYNGATWDRLRTAPAPATLGTPISVVAFLQANALLASAARTANGDSGALTGYGSFRSGIIQVDVTAASGTTPTLDVYIDTTTDGTTWINMAHLTQLTAVARRSIQISENTSGATADFDATADLAAATVRQGPWGSTIRVRWVITGTTPSFTFVVTGTFKS